MATRCEHAAQLPGIALGVVDVQQKPVDFGRFREALGCLGTYWLSINESPAWPGAPPREAR